MRHQMLVCHLLDHLERNDRRVVSSSGLVPTKWKLCEDLRRCCNLHHCTVLYKNRHLLHKCHCHCIHWYRLLWHRFVFHKHCHQTQRHKNIAPIGIHHVCCNRANNLFPLHNPRRCTRVHTRIYHEKFTLAVAIRCTRARQRLFTTIARKAWVAIASAAVAFTSA